MEKFDYIIVGAGSAGSVLANRLTADGRTTVLLLEAGGENNNLLVNMPAALAYPMRYNRFNWGHMSKPEPYMNNRRISQHRGKGLGGSSAINGMVYVRGHACDYDEWEELGAAGWGYRHVLPYFRQSEGFENAKDESYRSTQGGLKVSRGLGMAKSPLYQAFIQAAVEAGYPATNDYNGYQQEGFGPYQMTVAEGERWSAAKAFLKPARSRRNLKVETYAFTDRIVMENRRATGVIYTKGGKARTALANREVILSASAFNSPALLQVSGIGPAEVLRKAGVEVIHDLPGVGENLMDHLEVFFQMRCSQKVSLNGKLGLLSKAKIGLEWLLFKDGLGATNHFEAGGFIRSRAGLRWPDIQYHFLPGAISYSGQAAFDTDGYQVHVGPNKAKSRGHVRIRTGNMRDHPEILFNYLKAPEDVRDWRHAVRLTREIMNQPALDAFNAGEFAPGAAVQTDAEIDAWVKENAETAYHPCGTCKIGADDDPMAVLDPQCRVRGIDALRVVDSSVFPTIPNGNLNAPSIMVGEKGADMILGRDPMPASNADVWIDPHWDTRQRLREPIRALPTAG